MSAAAGKVKGQLAEQKDALLGVGVVSGFLGIAAAVIVFLFAGFGWALGSGISVFVLLGGGQFLQLFPIRGLQSDDIEQAGFMLRSIRNFHPGDFIVVDGHRGRVSELGLLRTEIQTERRTLTTFPNLYLVSNPVTVVRTRLRINCPPRNRVSRARLRTAPGA